jgi:hypothetical protein
MDGSPATMSIHIPIPSAGRPISPNRITLCKSTLLLQPCITKGAVENDAAGLNKEFIADRQKRVAGISREDARAGGHTERALFVSIRIPAICDFCEAAR